MPDIALRNAALLDASGLCTFYGTSQALFDVSLNVPLRGGVAILGRNGAGKTTLLKTLAGDLLPARGSVRFNGTDVARLPTEQRIRLGIGYVPQEQGVFGRLTVRENLLIGAMSAAGGKQRIGEMLALFPLLAKRLSQQAGTLSGGERKMLAISRALLGRPSLLMLDEPTEGVWHGVVREIATRLEELSKTIAILIVEQHVRMALQVSQYCYVMDRGQIALEGPSAKIHDDPELIRLLSP
jgi:branched-chain amino acid transport system ATP-binding protein